MIARRACRRHPPRLWRARTPGAEGFIWTAALADLLDNGKGAEPRTTQPARQGHQRASRGPRPSIRRGSRRRFGLCRHARRDATLLQPALGVARRRRGAAERGALPPPRCSPPVECRRRSASRLLDALLWPAGMRPRRPDPFRSETASSTPFRYGNRASGALRALRGINPARLRPSPRPVHLRPARTVRMSLKIDTETHTRCFYLQPESQA